jgi:imidazolonepropionase-like amidohydrolase
MNRRRSSTMSRHAFLAVAVAGVASGCGTTVHSPGSERTIDRTLAIEHVTVVDVASGTLLPEQTVIVSGSRIVAVGPTAQVARPARASVVDGRGRYLIPGLWDMHGHLWSTYNESVVAPLFVANGVTGVREMWTDWQPDSLLPSGLNELGEAHRLRTAIREGRVVGPRLLFAGAPLDGPPGTEEGVIVVRTAEEARAAVDAQATRGVDIVVVYQLLGREAFLAAAARASERGLRLGGFKPEAVSRDDAAAAGMRSYESLTYWANACTTAADSLLPLLRSAIETDASDTTLRIGDAYGGAQKGRFAALRQEWNDRAARELDEARCAELAGSAAARHDTWLAPRFVLTWVRALGPTAMDTLAPSIVYAPLEVRDDWQAARARVDSLAPDSARALAQAGRERWAHTARLVGVLHRAGIPFLAATETWETYLVPGFSLHRELALLQELGLPPVAALRAATLAPARYLGATDSLGTIAVGKLADLVLLDANPLDDVRNVARIDAVIVNGRLLDRTALDTMLTRARRAADGAP